MYWNGKRKGLYYVSKATNKYRVSCCNPFICRPLTFQWHCSFIQLKAVRHTFFHWKYFLKWKFPYFLLRLKIYKTLIRKWTDLQNTDCYCLYDLIYICILVWIKYLVYENELILGPTSSYSFAHCGVKKNGWIH